jgi:hypothetical protein
LIADLGGVDNLTTQQLVIVDLASRTKLLVDSLDAVLLLMQGPPINKRTVSVFPIVTQRGQEADRLARYMSMLGLERRAKPVPALSTYLEARYSSGPEPQDRVGRPEAAEMSV